MDIVERFLLEQLQRAIDEIRPTTSSISTMFHIREECQNVKDSIEGMVKGKEGGSVDARIKENLYYLINVMTEWRMLLEEHHYRTPEAIRSANKLRGKLNQIKKVVQDLKEKPDSVKYSDSEFYRWSSRSVDLDKIYGLEDHDMIMERLLTKEGFFKAIGIVGMAGIGKTTLCQKAFDNKQVKNHFLPRIWVCLSKQPHKEEVVKMILMGLGFERNIVDKIGEGEGGLRRLLLALRLQLKRQHYLIVLDDARNMEDDFNNFCASLAQDDDKKQELLQYGLPKGHGGAVIVTGRSPTMITNMVGEKNLNSLPLADTESCWKIFKDAAEKDGTVVDESGEEGKISKREIVKKCAGLPLTAKILGQVQHDKEIKETHQEA